MKKTSTYLSRHSFGIIAALAMLTCAFSASAEEYKSMIRYDRVWEHVSWYGNSYDVYYVRFDGPEEINGKTYHRLVSFRHARYKYGYEYNQDYNDYEIHVFDVDDSYYKHEGYLREENGKVYTLVANNITEFGYPSQILFTPNSDFPDSYTLEEKVLYDFTCKEGESYTGLYTGGEAFEMTYIVRSIEAVEIDGEEHRLLKVCTDEDEYMEEPIVEGVGIADNGCLTTIDFHRPSCPCWNYIFNRVLSTDGRVLYRAEHAAEIPVDDFLGTDGIAEITDPSATDAPIYDILGRRITDPVPGQLYIQDGKKHIAK